MTSKAGLCSVAARPGVEGMAAMPAAPPRVLILADDLSGAADCGVVCTEAGLDTLVLLDAAGPDGADALAVDLDSRGLCAGDARAVTRTAAGRLLGKGGLLYKKIDSTLRGNPAAEIAAARDAVAASAGGRALALVAPAFPATGRTTRGGRILVNGLPLERTDTWMREGRGADPDLAAMLGAAGLPVRTLPLAAVRSGGLADALRRALADGAGAVLCDADTDADLARIAAAGLALGPVVAWAGSAGLARQVVARAAADLGEQRRTPTGATQRGGPVVVVVGSMSAVARAQVAALAKHPRALAVTVTSDALRAGSASPDWAATGRSLDGAIEAARDGGIVAVSIGAGPDGAAPGRPLCAALAQMVAPHAGRMGALVSAGGETARAVLGLMGASGLRLVGEIEPGVPLGMAVGMPGAPLPVVTKAGAFGDGDTLVRCVAALRALPRAPAANTENTE